MKKVFTAFTSDAQQFRSWYEHANTVKDTWVGKMGIDPRNEISSWSQVGETIFVGWLYRTFPDWIPAGLPIGSEARVLTSDSVIHFDVKTHREKDSDLDRTQDVRPEHREIINTFSNEKLYPLVALSEIANFEAERVNIAKIGNDAMIIETGDVDPTFRTVSPKKLNNAGTAYKTLRRVHTGDILISRRRPYRGAIVEIPENCDGALAIPEFSILRMKDGYDRKYILEILRSKPFLDLMTIFSTGEMSNRISEQDLKRLRIPIPRNHVEIGQKIDEISQEIVNLEREISDRKRMLSSIAKNIILQAEE